MHKECWTSCSYVTLERFWDDISGCSTLLFFVVFLNSSIQPPGYYHT